MARGTEGGRRAGLSGVVMEHFPPPSCVLTKKHWLARSGEGVLGIWEALKIRKHIGFGETECLRACLVDCNKWS